MSAYAPAPICNPITRDGKKLIVPTAMPGLTIPLPPPCVKCGAPANGKPVTKTFSWHHPALYLVALVGLVIYVIVAMIVRKSIRLTVPLCASHAQKRSMAVILSWVIPLIGVADAFILPNLGMDGGVAVLITIACLLTGLIIWAVVSYPIRPRYIDQYRAEFTGLCEAYLQQFPPKGI